MEIFSELSIIIVIAVVVSVVMRLLKQPLVVGYILSGIIVGPYMLNVLHSTEHIELFSKIGISILLFIVGLSLSPHVIKEVGKVSLVTGIGQVLFTSVIGYAISISLGLSTMESIFVALALTFSSTIIVLKLLSDRGDVSKLYGRVAIGFLLVQDIIATIILLLVSSAGAGDTGFGSIAIVLLKAMFGIAVFIYFGRRILPQMTRFFASSPEFLFLFSIAWGLGLAALFATLGFSIEIGALIAGVTLSVSPFANEISSRLKPLRDFFILLFFILLGAELTILNAGALIPQAVLLSLFILIGNPLIVFIIMNLSGFRRRTSFMAGLTVAQISEFSLILMALGNDLGYVSIEAVSLVTLVGLITIAGSTYLLLYADRIYPHLRGFLRLFEWRKVREAQEQSENTPEVILFGYDRAGSSFVKAAKDLGKSFLVVDFDPVAIRKLEAEGLPYVYGDAEDIEFLGELHLKEAQMIISTIPEHRANMLLLRKAKEENPNVSVIAIAHTVVDAKELYALGATYVVMPHHLGAKHASDLIRKRGTEKDQYLPIQEEHMAELQKV